MADKVQVPNNIEDPTILKRFLSQLVSGLVTDPYYSGNVAAQNEAIMAAMQANPNLDFLSIASKLNDLRTDIQTYIADKIETVILQNSDDIAVIAQQFGTFYNQALAASWYGLSVKAGGAVAGLEVGSLDPDVTTPGDESSYFRVVANNFILGRAYEDLTQVEKDYLAANNLPNFGTVYNAQKQPVPALITTWDNTAGTYKHYFNGIVQFTNIQGADYANAINNGFTTINGGKITTGSVAANVLMPTTGGTTVWSGGALISQNFNGNSVGAIGSPTQGFRLSSNAGGTSSDPNIYGAYIKASYVESLYAPVVGTNNSGRFNYATSGTIVSIVGPNYGSGYINNRVVSITNSIVIIKGTVEIDTSTVQTSNISKYLQRSINGGAYNTIQTKTYYHNITTIDFWVTIDVYVNISIYIPGQGTFSGSDTDHQAQHVIIYPTMRVITSLEFYYIENLSAIGDFNSLSYTIPDGVVSITIHN